MMVKVLILGATGHIGRRLTQLLAESDWATVVAASRRPSTTQVPRVQTLALDTLDKDALRKAVADIHAVVNCVAGDANSIADGARLLAEAIGTRTRPVTVVHMSSMAVYGALEGRVTEDSPLDPTLGWYAKAKCDAEAQLSALAPRGHHVVIFRPGCVSGPGSMLWVDRIARLLLAGRLGDLGAAGDGWSNLVHVDDVCRAVLIALQSAPVSKPRVYNLADPASPRWNPYFADIAVRIGAVPVQRLSERRVKLDAAMGGPVLKVIEKIGGKLRLSSGRLPVPISPSLLKLWPQQISLDSQAVSKELGLHFQPYRESLEDGIRWFEERRAAHHT